MLQTDGRGLHKIIVLILCKERLLSNKIQPKHEETEVSKNCADRNRTEPCLTQDNVYSMGVQPFYGKGPHTPVTVSWFSGR
jgi:hypothetical protein